jgi:hypothetical protein
VNMIETLIIVRGKQIKVVYWDLRSNFGAKIRGLLAIEKKCHFNKLSMAIRMAN